MLITIILKFIKNFNFLNEFVDMHQEYSKIILKYL